MMRYAISMISSLIAAAIVCAVILLATHALTVSMVLDNLK